MRRTGSLPGLSGWTAFALTLASVVLTLLAMVCGAFVRAARLGVPFGTAFDTVTVDPLTFGLAQALGFGAVIGAWLVREGSDASAREALRLVPVRSRVVLTAFVLGVALHFPLAELGNVVEAVEPHTLDQKLRIAALLSPDGLLAGFALVLATVCVAPLAEELLFRGILLDGLATRYGSLDGIVLSSMLFGISHYDHVAAVVALAGGLVLGVVARRTGSIVPSIALHAGYNGVRIVLQERIVAIPGFNTVDPEVVHLSPGYWVPAALVAVAALHLLFVLTRDEDVSR